MGNTAPMPAVGRLFALDATEPHAFGDEWTQQSTTGPTRLAIGTTRSRIELMLHLATGFSRPMYVLLVVGVPRRGDEGKYESEALTYEEVEVLLRRHRDFLDSDPRTEVWLGEIEGPGLLVLDQHGLIYAYGDLETLEEVLGEEGLVPGEFPWIPSPHEHRYHDVFDEEESAIVSEGPWRRVLPLDEHDFAY